MGRKWLKVVKVRQCWRSRVVCDGKGLRVDARLIRATVHPIPLVVGGNNLPFECDRLAIGGRFFVSFKGEPGAAWVLSLAWFFGTTQLTRL